MKPRERFAINLRKARKKKGVSQEELGFRCDLHRTEISLLSEAGASHGSARSSSWPARSTRRRNSSAKASTGCPARANSRSRSRRAPPLGEELFEKALGGAEEAFGAVEQGASVLD